VLLLLFALSYYLNIGWQLPTALIGIYLVVKGFGLEDALLISFRGLGFSIDRLSFVFYIASMIFFIIALLIGFGNYISFPPSSSNYLVAGSSAVQGFLSIFPASLVLYLIGRIMDLENRRLRYRAISQGTYVGYSIVAIALLYLTAAWFIGQIYFWQFLLFGGIAMLLGYGLSLFIAFLRRRAIKRSRMKDKMVINDIGAYIGKVSDVDARRGLIFVKTEYGNVIKYDIDRITGVAERITIK
jgi:uncharacterized membrane protein